MRPSRNCGLKCSMMRRYVGARRVMELVDHDQFEMVRAPARQGASERLHRCEHDIGVRRPFVPREESGVAPGHDFPKDVPTLAENLFTVCNEQHAMGASFRAWNAASHVLPRPVASTTSPARWPWVTVDAIASSASTWIGRGATRVAGSGRSSDSSAGEMAVPTPEHAVGRSAATRE